METSLKVAIRLRPTASFADNYIHVHADKRTLTVRMPKADNPNAQDSWSWRFDALLHNASQETVYSEHVAPIVRSSLQGFNGAVLSYGQTGTGKTFTQLGSMENYHSRGIIPRALTDIFQYVQEHPQFDATMLVSYVEIHNDTLVDLLGTLPSEAPQSEALHIFEDKNGSTHVKGLRLEKVSTEEEALNLLFEGHNNRAIANHQLNRNSSRGHSIFTIYLKIRSRVESSGVVKVCKLHMVDLAGSERLKKTDTTGNLRAESMYINRSLTYLEQVVVALGSKGRSHTPYRQSKLTHLLKDSLGGNCKTLLIANVYGESQHLEETVASLHFAARVRLVPNEASVNEHQDPEQLLKKYVAQIADLKRELAMHDSLSSRSGVVYEPYSEMQRFALLQQLQNFLERQTERLELESVRQMRELLDAARILFDRKQAELEECHQRALTSRLRLRNDEGTESAATAKYSGGEAEEEGGLGSYSASQEQGIAIGKAPDSAKPQGGAADSRPLRADAAGRPDAHDTASVPTSIEAAVQESAPVGRQAAFLQFKQSEGELGTQRLLRAKKDLKEHRSKRSALAVQVNQFKRQIDVVKSKLDAKKMERDAVAQMSEDEADIIDEEEYALIQESRAAKTSYKHNREKLVDCSAALENCVEEVDSARQAKGRVVVQVSSTPQGDTYTIACSHFARSS